MSGIVLVVLVFLALAAGLGVVAYFTYQRKLRRAKAIERGLKMVPVLIHLPPPSADTDAGTRDVREVMREKTSQAEVLYNLIAGTATEGFKSNFYGQRHVALELIAVGGVVHFFAAIPVALVSTVTKAIQTAYPGARMEEVEDHNIFNQEGRLAATMGGEMVLRSESAYPIATYTKLERDPMEALLTALAGIDKQDGAAVQIMLRPAHAHWTRRSEALADMKRKGHKPGLMFSAADIAKAAVKSPEQRREEERARLGGQSLVSNLELSEVEAIEDKTKHPAFEVLIRVVVSTGSVSRSQQLLRDIATGFALFETPGMNGFKFLPAVDVQGLVTAFIFRFFPPELKSNILNSVELATLFHLPDSQFTPSSGVERQKSKQVDGPVQLPATGLLFGHNEFRGIKKEIRLSPEDRRRHTYILGQTGTGKSTMLENLAVQDMLAGNGFAFIDPHGDSAEKLLSMVPKHRAEDIVYFNPSDTQYPLGLNLFEFSDPSQKDFLIQETINMLYKLYDPGHTGIIGPRYEHWYRNAALTLMADPNGATFIEIPKVFTDTDYLKQKFKYLRDPTVIDFWTKEMGQTSDYHKSEMLGWFVSKFGAFQNNEMMRNIIGQTKSAFNIRDIMDNKKILIVNLSKGRIGELNSQLLGMIFVIKFQAAAMSRADTPEEQRNDFALYVDEFQNFSTDSFASILSEARKYRLNLIVANQFVGQLSDEIREAVFGNIGTIVAHRMGPEDAELMVKQFAPVFDVSDLVNIPNFNAVMRLMIGGLPSQPFTLRDSVPLAGANPELGMAIKQLSAAKFGRSKAQVEADILDRMSGQGATGLPGADGVAAAGGAPVSSPAGVAPASGVPGAAGVVPGATAEPLGGAATSGVGVPFGDAPVPAGPASSVATPGIVPTTGVPAAGVASSAPVNNLPEMAMTPPPIGAAPVGAASVLNQGAVPVANGDNGVPTGVVNTAGQQMPPVANIIPEPSAQIQPAQQYPASGMGTPLPTPAAPTQAAMAASGMATTPPPIGAPPVDLPAVGTPPVNASPMSAVMADPLATPGAGVVAQTAVLNGPPASVGMMDGGSMTPPPIGAPPVELPPAAEPEQVASPLPSPAAALPGAPVGGAGTLSLRDITGGKPPRRAVDLDSIPVMTPGTEPVASGAGAGAETGMAGGAALSGDPYANIDILGEGAAIGVPATMDTRPFVATPMVAGEPLPNDPYANIDILGSGGAVGSPAPMAAIPQPMPEPAQSMPEPLDTMTNMDGAMPAPNSFGGQPFGPADVTPLQSRPEPIAYQAAPQAEAAYTEQPGAGNFIEPVRPQSEPLRLQPQPMPEPALMPMSDVLEQPVPEPVQAAPEPTERAPIMETMPAAAPEVVAEPEAAVVVAQPERQPTVDELIHFVDPNAQAVLKRPDAPEAIMDGSEPSLSGLPEGVQLVKQPAEPVDATVQPVVTAVEMPFANMSKTPPPIGAAPVEVPPVQTVSQAPVIAPVTEQHEAAIARTTEPPVPDTNASLAEALVEAPAVMPAPMPASTPVDAASANMAPMNAAAADTATVSPETFNTLESVADVLEDHRQDAAGSQVAEAAKSEASARGSVSASAGQSGSVPAQAAGSVQAAASDQPDNSPAAQPKPDTTALATESKSTEPVSVSATAQPAKAPETTGPVTGSGSAPTANASVTNTTVNDEAAKHMAASPSAAAQIEKAEREIDDLLSVSLIRPDSMAGSHHRLPDVVQKPQGDGSEDDVTLDDGQPAQPHQTAQKHMAEHHGLKVIQPLEPIVPPREQFAKELAAMQLVAQGTGVPAAQGGAGLVAAGAAPVASAPASAVQGPIAVVKSVAAAGPVAASQPKPASHPQSASRLSEAAKPAEAVPAEPEPMQRPVQPTQVQPPVEPKEAPHPAVQSQPGVSTVETYDELPQAVSLAADDVAKAREEHQAQERVAVQQAWAEGADSADGGSEQPKPESEHKSETRSDKRDDSEAKAQPRVENQDQSKPSASGDSTQGSSKQTSGILSRRKRKRLSEEAPASESVEAAGEHIESEAEAAHNQPTPAEAEASNLTGKLILPTAEKPKPELAQSKAEKPKKLAPGEVYVDEHGNVMIGE